jgi:hypothetical protein
MEVAFLSTFKCCPGKLSLNNNELQLVPWYAYTTWKQAELSLEDPVSRYQSELAGRALKCRCLQPCISEQAISQPAMCVRERVRERERFTMKCHFFRTLHASWCRLHRHSRVLLATGPKRTLHYFLKHECVCISGSQLEFRGTPGFRKKILLKYKNYDLNIIIIIIKIEIIFIQQLLQI